MSQLTGSVLLAVMPRCPAARVDSYAASLSSAMLERNIITVTRAGCFLGQLALESGELRYFEELADGRAYEGRRDLGNVQPGDGPRYRGRGPIQLTGRANYRAAGMALDVDLEAAPERAAEPGIGFRVAAWYWHRRDLNRKADALDLEGITRAINGGLTHHERRVAYTLRALGALGNTALIMPAGECRPPEAA